jgi:hypothetical protein
VSPGDIVWLSGPGGVMRVNFRGFHPDDSGLVIVLSCETRMQFTVHVSALSRQKPE